MTHTHTCGMCHSGGVGGEAFLVLRQHCAHTCAACLLCVCTHVFLVEVGCKDLGLGLRCDTHTKTEVEGTRSIEMTHDKCFRSVCDQCFQMLVVLTCASMLRCLLSQSFPTAHLLNHGQHVGLQVLVSVRPHTQVELA